MTGNNKINGEVRLEILKERGLIGGSWVPRSALCRVCGTGR